MSARPSHRRRTRVGTCRWPWLCLPARRALDGAHDAAVRPAAAVVAVHGLDDLSARWFRRLRQQGTRLHVLPRLAVPALQPLLRDPLFPDREAPAQREALHGGDADSLALLDPGVP